MMSLKDFIQILQEILEENNGEDGEFWVFDGVYNCPIEEFNIKYGILDDDQFDKELIYWME